VPIASGEPLPSEFEQDGSIVMTFARPVTMPEFMRMLQAVTGLRASAPSSSDESATVLFMPSDGEQVAGGRVVWQGRLSDLLNQAADVFGADWNFNGGTLRFAQQITRTFMLHSLASELSVTGSVKSGQSESGSNLPEVEVSSTESMKVWSEIQEAIATITGENGKASFSPSTGSITVSGTPEVVRRVEAYLNQQNAMRLRRVAVAVKVISVTTTDVLTLTADLTGVINKAFGNRTSLRSVGDATSGLTLGILNAPGGVDSTTNFSTDTLVSNLAAVKGVTKAAISHSGALVTLSDQPAPLQVGSQRSYVKRVTTSDGDVSIEPGTVNTGLMMTVLPRIVEQNKILMRLSVAISGLVEIVTFGPSGSQVQLPEISTTGFLQNAVVTSGETMVLTGFEKGSDSSVDEGSPVVPYITGGTKKADRSREVTILMITAEILPEDPITVIDN
jgi:type IVB pilus formation R64 PilN family outer membrane protein